MSQTHKREVLLLVATGCTHCPSQIQHLSSLLKDGEIARLEILNIQDYPEIADQYGVRSVPWMKHGEYTLSGAHTLQDIKKWLSLADNNQELTSYIKQQLADGQLQAISDKVNENPGWLNAIIPLLADDETPIQVRLGIDTIMENMAGSPQLAALGDQLGKLSQAVLPNRQVDVIYYLGLTRNESAIAYLEAFLNSSNPEVVEAAQDALQEIKEN